MKLGVIGCGKMGTALVEGAVKAGVTKAADITGCDPFPAAREAFVKSTGASIAGSAAGVASASEVILLATKPQDIAGALSDIAGAAAGKPLLVISIAAGVTLAALEDAAPENLRIIRAMPNTPALVGKGAAGYCLGSRATAEDAAAAEALLGAVGLAVRVPEKLMDAVTGLSGSGPAYVYLVIEALADGGVKAGLPRADAIRLAAQTVAGAAAMVLETGEHPAVLKDMVTSPGGTTIAGLAALENAGVRSGFISAVDAATRRATELGAK
ncbi:pyrroline-5-carboxylate reductase [Luteolibacter sp. SL250]|uniref:pyrroline-5-carboxylate reductase n=1 Tax=Luteolibacter sp. SL250 TaxID=2995170 RepID=UPI002270F466|nr:pyrroline-5-carboxylate reductase [Luteolibacter sp. SL250]WAC20789.1 pyrroline-5-carboxylate reductase [Luteolibacter sp. SL250]